MPHLSELHGAATHLAVIAIPLYAVLLVLRRRNAAAAALEPWVVGAAVVGTAASGLTGLLVKGQSETQLRGSDYGIGGIHFWLGIALAVVVVVLAVARWRALSGPWASIAALALVAVTVQGYLGGRMTYEHGVGVQALGQARQTATGASRLHITLAQGTPMERAGEQAFSTSGLGCASCHGDRAQGARGPRLADGKDLADFRRVHAQGLFPPSVVTDRDFAAVDAWLKTLRRGA